jgi:anti-anti-sigma regulatory factor
MEARQDHPTLALVSPSAPVKRLLEILGLDFLVVGDLGERLD